MTVSTRYMFAALLSLALVCGIATADGGPSKTAAETVANRAIADIASWNLKAARNFLEKQKPKFGTTPEFRTAWALLEEYEGATGKSGKASQGMEDLASVAAKNRFTAAASYWQGELLYQANKRNEANAAWRAAEQTAANEVKKDPTDATAQFYLGAAQVRAKKFDAARTSLSLAARGGFDEAMVNHQIGLSRMFAEQWQQAMDAFTLGLSVNPKYAPSYYWRGMAWDKLGRKDNMLIDLDQFVKLAPDAPEAGRARTILKSAGG